AARGVANDGPRFAERLDGESDLAGEARTQQVDIIRQATLDLVGAPAAEVQVVGVRPDRISMADHADGVDGIERVLAGHHTLCDLADLRLVVRLARIPVEVEPAEPLGLRDRGTYRLLSRREQLFEGLDDLLFGLRPDHAIHAQAVLLLKTADGAACGRPDRAIHGQPQSLDLVERVLHPGRVLRAAAPDLFLPLLAVPLIVEAFRLEFKSALLEGEFRGELKRLVLYIELPAHIFHLVAVYYSAN